MEGVISESIGSDTERSCGKSTAPDAREGDDWKMPAAAGRSGRSGGQRRKAAGRTGTASAAAETAAAAGAVRVPRPPARSGLLLRQAHSNTPEREFANQTRDENAAPTVPKRRDAISDGDDLPLYGKLNFILSYPQGKSQNQQNSIYSFNHAKNICFFAGFPGTADVFVTGVSPSLSRLKCLPKTRVKTHH